MEWIRHKTNQITVILKTKEDLSQLQKKAGKNNIVIGLFHNFNDLLCRSFCLSAMTEKTLFFGMALTSNKEVFYEIMDKKEKVAEKIIVLKTGSNDIEKVEMKIDKAVHELNVWEFIRDTAHPLITTFQEENSLKLFSSKIQVHAMLFTNFERKSHFESMAIFEQVALKKRRGFHFMNVLSNATRLMKSFEVYYDELPVFYILDMANGYTYQKYKYEGLMNVDDMVEFMNDFNKGKLKGSRLKQPTSMEDIGADYYESIGKKVGTREGVTEEKVNDEFDEARRRMRKFAEIERELEMEMEEMEKTSASASKSKSKRGSDSDEL